MDQGRRADRNNDVALAHRVRCRVATASPVNRPRILRQTARINTDHGRHASRAAAGIDFAPRHCTQVEISE